MDQQNVDYIKQENAVLKENLDIAHEQIKQLCSAFAKESEIPVCLQITRTQRLILSALMRRTSVTKEQMYLAVYGARIKCDIPFDKTIEVHMCNLRRKLRPLDIHIETHRGCGWTLPIDSKAVIFGLKAQEEFPDLAQVAA